MNAEIYFQADDYIVKGVPIAGLGMADASFLLAAGRSRVILVNGHDVSVSVSSEDSGVDLNSAYSAFIDSRRSASSGF